MNGKDDKYFKLVLQEGQGVIFILLLQRKEVNNTCLQNPTENSRKTDQTKNKLFPDRSLNLRCHLKYSFQRKYLAAFFGILYSYF